MICKAVFFDLDGTLLDSVPTIIKTTGETLASMDIHIDDTTLRHAIGIPLKVQAHRFAPGREEEFIDNYRPAYLQRVEADTHLFPGTHEMLLALKSAGRRLGLVTSKKRGGTNTALKLTNLTDQFDVVITADDVTQYKPEPEPLLKAMEMLGVAPEESVYVGDASFDIEMSRRAGVRVVAVSWGARTREELSSISPDGIVDNWDQFLAMLESLSG